MAIFNSYVRVPEGNIGYRAMILEEVRTLQLFLGPPWASWNSVHPWIWSAGEYVYTYCVYIHCIYIYMNIPTIYPIQPVMKLKVPWPYPWKGDIYVYKTYQMTYKYDIAIPSHSHQIPMLRQPSPCLPPWLSVAMARVERLALRCWSLSNGSW